MWALDSETSKKMCEHLRFREPHWHCHSAPHILGTPANIRINVIFLETSIVELHFAVGSFCLSSFEFFWHAPKDLFLQEWRFGRSRSFYRSLILFGANRKRICDFVLVRHINLGHILHRFGDIADFFVLLTPPLFHPNFGSVLIAPDRPCWGQPAVARTQALKQWFHVQ